eukprot:gene7145-12798_t
MERLLTTIEERKQSELADPQKASSRKRLKEKGSAAGQDEFGLTI